MSIIFVILPITLLLSLCAVAAFSWATRGGQFDDLRTPAMRALHDPPRLPEPRQLTPVSSTPVGLLVKAKAT